MQALTQTLEPFLPSDTVQGYIAFLQHWLLSDKFFGCMFINACGEFSERSHPAHQLALQHKQAVLTVLTERLVQAKFSNPEKKALDLFIFGEGVIAARQTGILSDDKIKALTFELT